MLDMELCASNRHRCFISMQAQDEGVSMAADGKFDIRHIRVVIAGNLN